LSPRDELLGLSDTKIEELPDGTKYRMPLYDEKVGHSIQYTLKYYSLND